MRDIYFSNAEPELSGPRPRRPVPLKNAGKQATPLFHEIYGNYYAVIAAILHRIGADTVKVSALDGLLQNAFEDGRVNLVNKMLKDWKLLIRDPETKGVFAPITKLPEIPLTTLEVRWLKTALADPRASLFLPEEGVPETGDLQPLYSPEQIVCYDRYTDGDPFTDPEYRQRFRLILKAVREHRQLGVAFLSTNSGQERYDVVCPYGLEYSEKDDKFRMIARKPDQSPMQINLSSIRYCEDKGPFAPVGDGAVPPQRERTLELLLFDNNNALERVMLHFSDLKKRTRKLDDRRYRVELTYQAAEEKEMIMRLLSFGPAVKVLSPDSVVEEIRQRLQRQLALTEVGQQG